MEYVAERGTYDDVPLAAILDGFRAHYTGWGEADDPLAQSSFDDDVEREVANGAR